MHSKPCFTLHIGKAGLLNDHKEAVQSRQGKRGDRHHVHTCKGSMRRALSCSDLLHALTCCSLKFWLSCADRVRLIPGLRSGFKRQQLQAFLPFCLSNLLFLVILDIHFQVLHTWEKGWALTLSNCAATCFLHWQDRDNNVTVGAVVLSLTGFRRQLVTCNVLSNI